MQVSKLDWDSFWCKMPLNVFTVVFASKQLQFPSGCSPKTVLLSYIDELVCVGVWRAVVLRSLHVSDLPSDGRREDLMG